MSKRGAGWLQVVQRVVEDLSGSDVSEFELAQKDFRLRLRRKLAPRAAALPQEPSVAVALGSPVLAPFTGIFYRASSPTTEPYVHDGDWVREGATVGLIETMKIFNEVKAEQSGRVERIFIQSGQLVQAGDTIMTIVPGEPPADLVPV